MRSRRYPQTPPPKVGTLMKPGLPAVAPEECLSEAAARMRRDRVGALTVMREGRLIGIITERDLLRAVADGLRTDATPVASCMTPEPCTTREDGEALAAAEKMIQLGVRHLPVTREGQVVGVISARDLLPLGRPRPLEELEYEPW